MGGFHRSQVSMKMLQTPVYHVTITNSPGAGTVTLVTRLPRNLLMSDDSQRNSKEKGRYKQKNAVWLEICLSAQFLK